MRRGCLALCILASVGCGKVASSWQGDGGGSAGPESARGVVRVTLLDRSTAGGPAGVLVVFVDPDGTLVKAVSTDADDSASAEVLPGASVTAVVVQPHLYQMRTTLGVMPGDDLRIGTRRAAVVGSFTVSWPAAPGDPVGYAVYGPCGLAGTTDGQTLSMTLAIATDCKTDAMELLVCAQDAAGNSLSFNDRTDVPFLAGGSAAMADAWSSGLGFTASYTNLTSIASIQSDRHVTAGNGFASTLTRATIGMASTTLDLIGPTSATGRMESSILSAAGGEQIVREQISGEALAYSLDVGGTLLPWLMAPTRDTGGQLLHIARLTTGTSGTPADLLELDLSWQRADGFYSWSVFGPDAELVRLPALPRSPASIGAELNPSTSDDLRATAIAYEADVFAGYDTVRPNIDTAIAETFLGPRSQARVTRMTRSAAPTPGGGGW